MLGALLAALIAGGAISYVAFGRGNSSAPPATVTVRSSTASASAKTQTVATTGSLGFGSFVFPSESAGDDSGSVIKYVGGIIDVAGNYQSMALLDAYLAHHDVTYNFFVSQFAKGRVVGYGLDGYEVLSSQGQSFTAQVTDHFLGQAPQCTQRTYSWKSDAPRPGGGTGLWLVTYNSPC